MILSGSRYDVALRSTSRVDRVATRLLSFLVRHISLSSSAPNTHRNMTAILTAVADLFLRWVPQPGLPLFSRMPLVCREKPIETTIFLGSLLLGAFLLYRDVLRPLASRCWPMARRVKLDELGSRISPFNPDLRRLLYSAILAQGSTSASPRLRAAFETYYPIPKPPLGSLNGRQYCILTAMLHELDHIKMVGLGIEYNAIGPLLSTEHHRREREVSRVQTVLVLQALANLIRQQIMVSG